MDLEDIWRLDYDDGCDQCHRRRHRDEPQSMVHYMTQYIKQGVEEPIYYSLFY